MDEREKSTSGWRETVSLSPIRIIRSSFHVASSMFLPAWMTLLIDASRGTEYDLQISKISHRFTIPSILNKRAADKDS